MPKNFITGRGIIAEIDQDVLNGLTGGVETGTPDYVAIADKVTVTISENRVVESWVDLEDDVTKNQGTIIDTEIKVSHKFDANNPVNQKLARLKYVSNVIIPFRLIDPIAGSTIDVPATWVSVEDNRVGDAIVELVHTIKYNSKPTIVYD